MKYFILAFAIVLFSIANHGQASEQKDCGLGFITQSVVAKLTEIDNLLFENNCNLNPMVSMKYEDLILLEGVSRVIRAFFILKNTKNKILLDKVMMNLVEQSNGGNQFATLLLANIQHEKAIDKKGFEQAVKLYKAITMKDLEFAYFQLGIIFFDSPLKNITKSREYLFKASKVGVPGADYVLGLIEYDEKNFEKAVKLFTNAGNHCHSKALFNLAVMYEKGEGVAKDTSTTLKLMERSAECGYVEAMRIIGRYFINDSKINDKRNLRGQFFLEQAFSKGDLKAGFLLAGYRITEDKKNNAKLTKEELIENMSMMKIVAQNGMLAAMKIYVYQSFDFYREYGHYYDKPSFVQLLNILVSKGDKNAIDIKSKMNNSSR